MAPEDCRYTHYENGIHEFVFLTDNKEGVDTFITTLDHIITSHPITDQVLLLIDFHQPKNPPTLYMFRQAMQLFQRHAEHPYMRAAYIYQQGFMISTVKMYISILRRDRKNVRQFFTHIERNQALAWLLE